MESMKQPLPAVEYPLMSELDKALNIIDTISKLISEKGTVIGVHPNTILLREIAKVIKS